MALTADPSIPPWTCSDDVLTNFRFVCENKYWSDVHSVTNFLAFYYFMDIRLSLLLMFFWESFEALLTISIGARDVMINETIGDSLVGDVSIGLAAIFIGYLYSKLTRFRYSKIPPHLAGNELTLLKYLFQFVILAAPTGVMDAVPTYFGNGFISITYIVFIIWIPSFYALFAYWNKDDPEWGGMDDKNDKGDLKPQIIRSFKLRPEYYYTYHRNTTIFLFIWLALFIFRWSSVFIMVGIYDVAIITTLIVLLKTRNVKIIKW
jgi:hypothetical protein